MRDHFRGIVDRHVDDVRKIGVDVAIAGRLDMDRLLIENIAHDRKIVRREVPQYVQIRLEEAEVDPEGIVGGDGPQRAAPFESLSF